MKQEPGQSPLASERVLPTRGSGVGPKEINCYEKRSHHGAYGGAYTWRQTYSLEVEMVDRREDDGKYGGEYG